MKTILVPLETDDLAESTLETAVLLAKVFGSYIEGFAFRPLPSSILATDPTGAALVFGTNIQRENDRVEASRRTFEKFMLTHDVSRRTNATARPSFGWREEASPGDYFVGSYSRVFDIAVIGRLGANEAKPRMSTLEAALFESGRPVLIAPRVAPLRLGESVVIAWNGSTETARTIGFAMPLLRQARRTVVLSVEGIGTPGPTGDQVANNLELNGIACESYSVKADTSSAGEIILAEATKLESDLLIKGAFTQSRLRQMIFGGATRHIIAEASLPVFMAH